MGVPLVLLCAQRVPPMGGRRATAIFSGALAVTALCSYQLAANALLALGLLAVHRRVQRCGPTARQAATWLVGVATTLLVLGLASLPYVARLGEARERALLDTPVTPGAFRLLVQGILVSSLDPVFLALAATGAGLAWCAGTARRARAGFGVLLAVTGVVLACGPGLPVGDVVLPLPWALLALLPGGAVVQPPRYLLLTAAGMAILAGLAVDEVRRRLPSRPGGAVALLLLAIVAAEAARVYAPPPTTCLAVARRSVLDRWLRDQPGGAVLDLRRHQAGVDCKEVDAADAMLASLVHEHPSLTVHTRHRPEGTDLVARTIGAGPSAQTLRALVDMTHLRWIVLPPGLAASVARGWGELPGVAPVAYLPDGVLLRVDTEPRPGWFEALRQGPRPDRTLLGTPLVPVAAPAATLRVDVLRSAVRAGDVLRVVVTAENRGPQPWPVAVGAGADPSSAVGVDLRWDGPAPAQERLALPFDVGPGASVQTTAWVTVPAAPGAHVLRVAVAQGDTVFPAPVEVPVVVQ